MGRTENRAFERRAKANAAALKAKTLDRLGVSDAMWETLQTLHLARLTPERGRPAPMAQATLAALQRRGLAAWVLIDGEDPVEGNVSWSCTADGAAMIKEGRP